MRELRQVSSGLDEMSESTGHGLDQFQDHPAPEGRLVLPPSGFRLAASEIGRAIGLLTWPVWRPLTLVITSLASDTRQIVRSPLLFRDSLAAWWQRSQSDLANWDRWTPAERASVMRQQGVWLVAWTACAVLALTAGSLHLGAPALLPLALIAIAWTLRSHRLPRPTWWPSDWPTRPDLVRWLLDLDQIPE